MRVAALFDGRLLCGGELCAFARCVFVGACSGTLRAVRVGDLAGPLGGSPWALAEWLLACARIKPAGLASPIGSSALLFP
jgi:hypothetical protein